jgi:hypothetical protein
MVEGANLFHQDLLAAFRGEEILVFAKRLQRLLGGLDAPALLAHFALEPAHRRLRGVVAQLHGALHVSVGQGIDDLGDQLGVAALEAQHD